jgi:GNAT superfamily N-acetyltransferase
MSTNIKLIEVQSLKYNQLRELMNKQPVEHLLEVPFGDFKLDLNICDEIYTYSEQIGHCKCYAAFVNEEYAGYMIIMASEMVHHKGTMQAVTDSFYITPAYRSAGVFQELLQTVEQDLKANNIRFLTVGLNPNMPHFNKMDNMLSQSGYLTTEVSVTKEL